MTITKQDRDLAVEAMWQGLADRWPGTRQDYDHLVSRYMVIPTRDQDQIIGGVLIHRNEIHVSYSRPPKTASMRVYIRVLLQGLLDQYGSVKTKVMTNNQRGIRFCQRLGFTITAQTPTVTQMQCLRCNYV